MKNEEALIQCSIVKELRSKGELVFSIANEAAGSNVVRQGQLITMGLLPGVSDLVLVRSGEVIFIEVKKPGGKQSPAQVRFQAKVEGMGYRYILVYGLDEVLNMLYV